MALRACTNDYLRFKLSIDPHTFYFQHGNRFNNQPNVKLSESFGVDLGGTQETPKQVCREQENVYKETAHVRSY